MPYEKSETAKNWKWTNGTISAAYIFAKKQGQEPVFKILKKDNIPIGIMLFIKNFKEKTNKKTSFIWYLQKAPNEYLIKNNIDEKQFDIRIPKVIIDIALTCSLKITGNVLLHADTKGKDSLINFYKKEGFTQISIHASNRISTARPNDGRYFYSDKENSLKILFKNRRTINQQIFRSRYKNKLKDFKKTVVFKSKKMDTHFLDRN